MSHYRYNELLTSELIVLMVYSPQNTFIKNEIYRRLKFCGFDDKTILLIIEKEIEIIKKRKITQYDIGIVKQFIWLDKKNPLVGKKKLFNDKKEIYYAYSDRPAKKTSLTLAELIWIFDEAYYISKMDRNYPKIVLDEVDEIAIKEDTRSWIIQEFYSRIENIYRKANNIRSDCKNALSGNNIDTFYDNELHILFANKWNKMLGVETKYEAYTDDYYQYGSEIQ